MSCVVDFDVHKWGLMQSKDDEVLARLKAERSAIEEKIAILEQAQQIRREVLSPSQKGEKRSWQDVVYDILADGPLTAAAIHRALVEIYGKISYQTMYAGLKRRAEAETLIFDEDEKTYELPE